MLTKQQLENAKTCIAQLKRGEWLADTYKKYDSTTDTFIDTPFIADSGKPYHLVRKDQKMWVANGGMFLMIDKKDYFGLYKYWVWHWVKKSLVSKQTELVLND